MIKDLSFFKRSDIYMLSHSVGLPPRSSRAYAENSYFKVWENHANPWESWIAGIEEFKERLARLFNGRAGDFCPQANLSGALTKLIYSLPKRAGRNKILLSECDFPSMGFVLDRAQNYGYELQFIPEHENMLSVETWDNYLTDDIHCALLTHVQSNTGIQVPISEVTALTSQREIISIVDVAQSAGVIPIDLSFWRADFVLGSCVKWLCGGPGAAYLWGNPEILAECEPVDVGWFSHTDPFQFDIHHFRYADDARRFWGGTPSVLPYIIAANSIATLSDIGINEIRRHNIMLTQMLIDSLDGNIVFSPKESGERGGTVVLQFKNNEAKVSESFKQRSIMFDKRESGIRLSPHIYNTIDEMDQVLDCCNA